MIVNPKTRAINDRANCNQLGIYPNRGDKVIIDTPTRETFKWVVVRGSAGDIVIKNADGQFFLLPACGVGTPRFGVGVMVASSGTTVDGHIITTTATDIWWQGGL